MLRGLTPMDKKRAYQASATLARPAIMVDMPEEIAHLEGAGLLMQATVPTV
jgi:hypothetical protein